MDLVLRGNKDLIGPKSLPNQKSSLSCPLILLMELLGSLFGFSKRLRVPYAIVRACLAFGFWRFGVAWKEKIHMKKEDSIFSSTVYYTK